MTATAEARAGRAQTLLDVQHACSEYVRTCRAAARENAYERVEPLAWQQLVDDLRRAGVELLEGDE